MTRTEGAILVINAGSSSVKYALFDGDMAEVLSGQRDVDPVVSGGHSAALHDILAELSGRGFALSDLRAAAHRVVHGGAELTAPCRIDAQVLGQIRAAIPLAPLHNPHNLLGIMALAEIAPDLPQFASFDTAFHATNPEVAVRYGVPDDWVARGVRRYGFHGTSYQSLVAAFPEVTGTALPKRVLAFHLGNGASICAIYRGKSVATTMGYSPLEGLTMGTRAGSIDAGAVLDMAEMDGVVAARAALNQRSGLMALSGGESNMKTLCGRSDKQAVFAVDHFCYWAARHGGSMIAALQGVDAIAFTGGIGENAADVRTRIMAQLQWTGICDGQIHVIPAQEERQIARNAQALMSGK
ncbi:MAG: acetate kinase [Rhodobacterales bacterium]|nr:acetate kinase [Rhodobacterales bacterium]